MSACLVFKAEEHGGAFANMQGMLSFLRDEYGAAEAASLRRAHSAEFPLPPLPDPSSSGSDDDDDDDDCEETASLRSQELRRIGTGWTPEMSRSEEEKEDPGGDEAASFQAAPYVHPLARRSAASLSDRSLEICTENLGSETGSDGFCSYPQYDATDTEDRLEPLRRRRFESPDHRRRHYCAAVQRSAPRSFPPPLPSLPRQIQSRRENGRLVLEAVSQPPPAYFRAQRLGGRLLLSLVEERSENDGASMDGLQGRSGDVRESEPKSDDSGCRDETPAEASSATAAGSVNPRGLAVVATEKKKAAKATHPHLPSLGRLPYRKAALMGHAYFQSGVGEQLLELAYRQLVDLENGDRPKSDPPRRRDENSCKSKDAPSPPLDSPAHPAKNRSVVAGKAQLLPLQWSVVLLTGKITTECFVPLFRGCKQPAKKSIVIWEPYRIATSS